MDVGLTLAGHDFENVFLTIVLLDLLVGHNTVIADKGYISLMRRCNPAFYTDYYSISNNLLIDNSS